MSTPFTEVDRLRLALLAAQARADALEAELPTGDIVQRELHAAIARCDSETSLPLILQKLLDANALLGSEIAHFAAAEFAARQDRAEALTRVQELEAEVAELKERVEQLGKEPVARAGR